MGTPIIGQSIKSRFCTIQLILGIKIVTKTNEPIIDKRVTKYKLSIAICLLH